MDCSSINSLAEFQQKTVSGLDLGALIKSPISSSLQNSIRRG